MMAHADMMQIIIVNVIVLKVLLEIYVARQIRAIQTLVTVAHAE
jgi:hypothetical protein